jgi:hypothetical protein
LHCKKGIRAWNGVLCSPIEGNEVRRSGERKINSAEERISEHVQYLCYMYLERKASLFYQGFNIFSKVEFKNLKKSLISHILL